MHYKSEHTTLKIGQAHYVKGARLLDLIAVFVGLFWFVKIDIVGELHPAELLLFALCPILVSRWGKRLQSRNVFILLCLGGVWFFSQVITDLVRATPVNDLMRGWAAIVFFITDFIALYLLLAQSTKRIQKFIIAFACGGVLQVIFDPYANAAVEWWKFGYGLPVSLLLLSFASIYWPNRLNLIVIFGGLLGVLSIYLNARSLGGMLLTTVLVYFVASKQSVRSKLFKGGFKIVLCRLVGLLFLISSAMLFGYIVVGQTGILDEKAKIKYDMVVNNNIGLFGIILGGRSEILVSSKAVIDSPFIGHGSWAKNAKYKKYSLALYDLGFTDDLDQLKFGLERSPDLILAHSTIMQAWVWAGIAGTLFWFYVAWLAIKTFVVAVQFQAPYLLLLIFVLIRVGWDWAFSPFAGGVMRFTWAWEIILILFCYNYSRQIQQNQRKKSRAQYDYESQV